MELVAHAGRVIEWLGRCSCRRMCSSGAGNADAGLGGSASRVLRVVGYKPSYGSIPRSGVYELAHSLDHVGIFARHVTDAAFVASLLTANDGLEFPRLLIAAPVWPVAKAVKSPRIVVLRTSMWERSSREQ